MIEALKSIEQQCRLVIEGTRFQIEAAVKRAIDPVLEYIRTHKEYIELHSVCGSYYNLQEGRYDPDRAEAEWLAVSEVAARYGVAVEQVFDFMYLLASPGWRVVEKRKIRPWSHSGLHRMNKLRDGGLKLLTRDRRHECLDRESASRLVGKSDETAPTLDRRFKNLKSVDMLVITTLDLTRACRRARLKPDETNLVLARFQNYLDIEALERFGWNRQRLDRVQKSLQRKRARIQQELVSYLSTATRPAS